MREISWSNNIIIMEKCKDDLQREFYIQMTKRYGWTKRILTNFIAAQTYEKYLLNAGQAERDKYIEEHPDFLNDYPVSYEHRELLQDELYRKLLRRIRAYETGEKAEKKE